MTGLRIALIIVGIFGLMYAAAGLMSSLTDFGIGVAVVATAVVLHGLVVFIGESESARMQRIRDEVWARRDREER